MRRWEGESRIWAWRGSGRKPRRDSAHSETEGGGGESGTVGMRPSAKAEGNTEEEGDGDCGWQALERLQ
jgi:hypothetical protein